MSSAKPRSMKNDISHSLGLDLDNINVYAEVYQNIPLSSRDKAISLFQNLALGKASTDDKCHFAIVSLFFRIWTLAKTQPISNVSWQSHGVQLVNINVNTKFHHNIPLSSRIAPLSFFQNLELGKASTNEKCHFAISLARSCQYQCLRNSLSKYSTQFKR